MADGRFTRLKISQRTSIWAEWMAIGLSLGFNLALALYLPGAWFLAAAASTIYLVLVLNKQLLAESFLHAFYVFMAFWGYQNAIQTEAFNAPEWLWHHHLLAIVVAAVLAWLLGSLLKRFTNAKLPLLDSSTTVFSLLATWMMVHYMRENWLYFIGIDLASAYLYAKRGMRPTAFLYLAYTALAAYAWWQWQN